MKQPITLFHTVLFHHLVTLVIIRTTVIHCDILAKMALWAEVKDIANEKPLTK